MAGEPIGEIPVLITGDDSELQKAINDAVRMSQEGAEKISGAFYQGFQGSDEGLKQFIDTMGKFSPNADAIIQKQKQLDDELVRAKGALVEVQMAYDAGAVSVNALVRAQDAVADAAKRANVAFSDEKEEVTSLGNIIADAIQHPLKAAADSVREFAASFGDAGIIAVGVATGIGVVVKEIGQLVLEAGHAAEETSNLADRLNLTFEQTKTLSEMAQIAGVSLGGLNIASARLADSMEGDSAQARKTASALNDLGVYASNSGDLLINFLQKLSEIPDATERISKAHEVLGRSSVQLEPLIKNYGALQEAVISLGGHLDSDATAKLLAADDAADKLSIGWTHLKESMAAAFSPAVTKVLDFLSFTLSQNETPPIAKQIDILSDKLDRLRQQGEDPGFLKFLAMLGGPQATGTGFTPSSGSNAAQIEATKAQLEALQSTKQADDQVLKYIADLDKARANELAFARAAGDRAKAQAAAAKEAAAALAAEIRGEQKSYQDLLKAQADVAKEQEAVNKALKDLGQISKTDEAVAKIVKDIETLNKGLLTGVVSLKQFTDAMKAANDQILNLRFREVSDDIIAFNQAVQQASATRDFEQNTNDVRQAMDLLDDTIRNKVMPDLASALPAGVMSLATAFKTLGLSVTESGDVTTKQIQALNTVLADSGSSLETIEIAWGKVSSQIQRLGRTDVPLLQQEYTKMLEAMQARGASIGQQLQLEQGALQGIINAYAQTGESATKFIIALENSRLKTQMLADASQAMGKIYVGTIGAIQNGINSLSKGLADAIVNSKSLGDVFVNVGKQIVTTILEVIIKQGITKLIAELAKASGILGSLGGALGGKAAGAAAGGAAGSIPTGSGGAGGAAGTGTAASSALGTGLAIANLGVAVAAGITQGIQMSRLINLTGEIEISTRQVKEQLVGGIQPRLDTYLPELKHLTDIWGELTKISSVLWRGIVNVHPVGSGGAGGEGPDFRWADANANGNGPASILDQTPEKLAALGLATTDNTGVTEENTAQILSLAKNIDRGNDEIGRLIDSQQLAADIAIDSATKNAVALAGFSKEQIDSFAALRQALTEGTGPSASAIAQIEDPLTRAIRELQAPASEADAIKAALINELEGGPGSTRKVRGLGAPEAGTTEALDLQFLKGVITADQYRKAVADQQLQVSMQAVADGIASLKPVVSPFAIEEGFTTPVTRGEMTVSGMDTGPLDRFTADQVKTATDQYRTALQNAAAALEQQRAASNALITTYNLAAMQAQERIGFAGSGGAGFRSGQAFNSAPVTQQQFSDWLQQYNATTTPFEAYGNAPSYFNSSQAQRDLQLLRMGGIRSHSAPPIDVAGMTANYQGTLNTPQVTVYAVDPSGVQLTNSIIMGLQRNGIRTR